MKYCSNCGSQINENDSFCPSCGANLGGGNTGSGYNIGIPKRNIVLAIVFSLITCGIYSIYWMVVMTDEANRASGEDNDTSGVMALIFTIITCGIYSFYWNYKMGKKLYLAGSKSGKIISDNSIIYLVLALFGLSIVNYCLIQNDLNNLSD